MSKIHFLLVLSLLLSQIRSFSLSRPQQSVRSCARFSSSSSDQLDDDRLRKLIADMSDNKNMHMQWSREEDLMLFRLFESGQSTADIANELRRGVKGVERRISKITDISSKSYVFRNEEWVKNEDCFPDVSSVYERILWDDALRKGDFSFEYDDRFEGPKVAPFLAPNESVKGRERLLIKAVPPHRIGKIFYRSRTVWDKARRINLVFVSSDNGMIKLEDTIAGYDSWEVGEKARNAPRSNNVTLYCDLDGVLCDFDRGVQALFRGRRPAEVSPKLLWSVLCKPDKNFYGMLPWIDDGRRLWNRIRRCRPVLLSGVPGRTSNSSNWAALQKREWVDRHLGEEFQLITCSSKNKYTYCNKGDILVDDSEKAREAWEGAGGSFVLFDPKKSGSVDAVLEAIATANNSFDFTVDILNDQEIMEDIE